MRAMWPERVSCNRGVSDQVRELREERDAVKLRAAEAADRAEGHAEQMRGKLARLESGRAALADVLRDVAAMVPEIELERPGSRGSLWTHDDPVAGARRALQALQVLDSVCSCAATLTCV